MHTFCRLLDPCRTSSNLPLPSPSRRLLLLQHHVCKRNVQTSAPPLLSRQWCTHLLQWCAPHVVVGQSTSLDSHGSLNSPRCESCRNYSTVPHPDVHTIAATQWCTQAMVHRQCNGACFASGGSLLSTIRASAPASSRRAATASAVETRATTADPYRCSPVCALEALVHTYVLYCDAGTRTPRQYGL